MIDVVLTPAQLAGRDLSNAQVVVLDILRASTTIVAALSSGAREVRLFDNVESARAARAAWPTAGSFGPVVLGGERQCVKVEGFDLGNSPREYQTHAVGGSTVLLSTTNGTRAAGAARDRGAKQIYIGSLLNASATAKALADEIQNRDTVLLCAGTVGHPSCEDIIGAGAILFALLGHTYRADLPFSDLAWVAYHTFTAVRPRLGAALRLGIGGLNIIEAGLEEDIDVCAAIDVCDLVVEVAIHDSTLTAVQRS